MPSSRVVGRASSSGSRVKSEYSVCRALMGCTACARRIVSGAASESPRYRTFPASTSSFIAPIVAELGGEDDLVAPALNSLSDELLVGERTVHIRRIEEGHAELYRPVDRGDRLSLVRGSVELAHPHAPEAQRRDDESLASQVAMIHRSLLPSDA